MISIDIWRHGILEYLTIYDIFRHVPYELIRTIDYTKKVGIAKRISKYIMINKFVESIREDFIDGLMEYGNMSTLFIEDILPCSLNILRYLHKYHMTQYMIDKLLPLACKLDSIENIEYIHRHSSNVILDINDIMTGDITCNTLDYILCNCNVNLDLSDDTDDILYKYCDNIYKTRDILKKYNVIVPNMDNSSLYCGHVGLYGRDIVNTPSLNYFEFYQFMFEDNLVDCQWMIDNIPGFKDEFCYDKIMKVGLEGISHARYYDLTKQKITLDEYCANVDFLSNSVMYSDILDYYLEKHHDKAIEYLNTCTRRELLDSYYIVKGMKKWSYEFIYLMIYTILLMIFK